ncbi:MAG TPA: phosphotransferase [Pseudolysinimonas sp.]|nr:phosphotransferase [Pseudolysinimonas sp.]
MQVSALLAAELSVPFERVTDAEAATLALRHWGITPTRANRVDTERDDTFRLETSQASYALKITHPADDRAVIDLQTSAIEWAASHDPSLPLPRPIPTVDATLQPLVSGRVARLFPWMPGQSLRAALWDAAPEASLLHSIGATHARLTAALAGFRHPAESRALAWDVARLPELVGLTEALDDPVPVAAVLDRHLAETAPRLAALPQQFIHNDGNLDNLLVDERATGVVAVLDFGDAVRTARVLDLAVVASYLLPADDQYSASDTLDGLVAGWERVLPLDPDERRLLPRLVLARLVQRLLLASWLSREVPDNTAYLGRNLAITRAQFDIARQEGW